MKGGERLAARLQASKAELRRHTSDAVHSYPTTSLPFHADVFPFGFLLRIQSNHPSVIQIAQESWSCFAPGVTTQPLELRFIISKSSKEIPPRVDFRAQNNLLIAVADAHNSALCDLKAGIGFVHLSETAVHDWSYLRYNFLEAIAYTLLDAKHVVAVHAACVAKNGNGFLLFGDSGAGKSSLAYACARRGWTYVSDDCTFMPRRTSGRVGAGNPRTFRFRPAASSLFPEIEGPVLLRNGKPTIEIKSAALPSIKTATRCRVDQIVFLNRSTPEDSVPTLRPVSRSESWRRVSEQNAWAEELDIQQERQDTLETLLDAHAFELNYSNCFHAVDTLEQVACCDTA